MAESGCCGYGWDESHREAMATTAFPSSWMDSASACGDANHPERYAISVVDGYLSIGSRDERISTVADASQAWVFHTHEKAVRTARELTRLMGRLHEVVPLR